MENLAIRKVEGRGIPLPGDDIDTDRVTPARFLKVITFEGLEKALFIDERERTPDHPLDNPAYQGGKILFVGKNFGSGSSREHAPQAIKRFGIDAIVGESFGEIFMGNCLAIGLVTATASPEDAARLIEQTQRHPETEYVVDVEKRTISFSGASLPIEIQEARRMALLNGTWNSLANLRANMDKIQETAARLPYVSQFQE